MYSTCEPSSVPLGLQAPSAMRAASTTRPAARFIASSLSLEAWHDLLAEQPQRLEHPGVRDQAAGVEFRQDAVEADHLLQLLQALDHARGRADDHPFAQ